MSGAARPSLLVRSATARQFVLGLRNDTGAKILIEVASVQADEGQFVETGSCDGDGPRHLRDHASAVLPGDRTRVVKGVVENSYIPGFLVWILPGHEVTLVLPRDEQTRPQVAFFSQRDVECESGVLKTKGRPGLTRAAFPDEGRTR